MFHLKGHSELGDTATLITNAHDRRGYALASLPFLALFEDTSFSFEKPPCIYFLFLL